MHSLHLFLEEQRSSLLACESGGEALADKRKIRDQRVRLMNGIVLPHRYEIDALALQKPREIRQILRHCIIGCKCDEKRAVTPQMRLCRHGDRGVGDSVRYLRHCVPRAGGDDESIKRRARTKRLCRIYRVDDIPAANGAHLLAKGICDGKARVGAIHDRTHYRQNLKSRRNEGAHNLKRAREGAEGSAHSVAYHEASPP